MFRVVVSILLATAQVFGDPIPRSLNPFTPQGKIVGGKETTIEEHPWQVSIQSRGSHFCGGSVIAKDMILTAGHCTTSFPASAMSVRIGSAKTKEGGEVHNVSQIIRHEKYRINLFGIPTNDVAVLKLNTSIDLETKVARAIPLFEKGEKATEGTMATISGWGTLTENGKLPAVLQTVQVPMLKKLVCDQAYLFWGGVPSGQICAAYPAGGKDTCQGDSGGPLVISGRQAGIVSWGNGCARKGYPGVYTEVAAVREWLSKRVKI